MKDRVITARKIERHSAALFLALCCLWFVCPLASFAEFNSNLNADYLEREFEWAMFVETRDLKQYLNYEGTSLHPLTKVWIHWRDYRRSDTTLGAAKPSQVYEELWYYRTTPVGSRRHINPTVSGGRVGAVVLGKTNGSATQAAVATNVALRTIIDLELKDTTTGALMVAAEDYDLVAQNLAAYGFYQKETPSSGKHMSITLRAYPGGRDERLYLR